MVVHLDIEKYKSSNYECGCEKCRYGINISNAIYVIPIIEFRSPPWPPRWFSCKLNRDIRTIDLPIPPEECPVKLKIEEKSCL